VRSGPDAAGEVLPLHAPGVPADLAGEARERPRAAAWPQAPAVLFQALLVVGVLPIWLVTHLPTQDGGNHVESVLGLLQLPSSPLLQEYLVPNYGLQPNWLTQIALAGLVQLFSPRVAEKLILTGYLVLLPLAFRTALPDTARGRWAALIIFPFLHSYPFHMGFWNFSYSIVLFFVVVGYWQRRRGRLDARRGLVFSLLTTLLFVAHSVSTGAALATLAAMLAWRCGLGLHRGRTALRRRRILRGTLVRGAVTALCALPAVALLALFFARQPNPFSHRPPLLVYLKHLVSLYPLVSFTRSEIVLASAVSGLLALAILVTLAQRASRRLRPVDGWLAAAVVATALYFATPDTVADGAQLNDRLGLYPFFAAALWIGHAAVPAPRVRRLALALVAVFVAATGLRVVAYRTLDAYLADYYAVTPHIAPGSTILPLTFAPYGPREGGAFDGRKLLSYRVKVFQHAAGYVAAERRAVDLDNSQANTRHAPLRWKPEVNPFTFIGTRPFGLEDEPPCVELRGYAAVGGRIDYVLLWGATPAAWADECGSAVLAELATDWRQVWVSPRGMLQLFRPVPLATASAPREVR
jgi:hypothetical protein